MLNPSQQRTLATATQIQGTGFWSGTPVTVGLHPAAANTGIVFQRTDQPAQPKITSGIEAVHPTPFRTRLVNGNAAIDMTEHLLSALYACGVDNCLVSVNAQELPSLDGSALGYLDAIQNAGVVEACNTDGYCASNHQHKIIKPIRIGDADHWILAMPSDDNELSIEFRLDYGRDSVIAPGSFKAVINEAVFSEQIAAARTFVTQREAEHIQSLGLANHVGYQDLLVFGDDGPIENALRFKNECARHKVLDLIGDLALAGLRLTGRIIAYRSGHALNAALATAIVQQYKKTRPAVLSSLKMTAAIGNNTPVFARAA